MAVVVNTNNEQEEKVLLAFLESLKYDYYTDNVKTTLTDEQAKEILTRDKNLAEGKTSTRPWDEIKKNLQVYTVELLLEAEADIKDACEWYKYKQQGLVNKFLSELNHYFDLISARSSFRLDLQKLTGLLL